MAIRLESLLIFSFRWLSMGHKIFGPKPWLNKFATLLLTCLTFMEASTMTLIVGEEE
jgi:hypothetical protein